MPGNAASGVDLIVLDVNETLTDLTPMADVFARIGAPGSLGSRWFQLVLQTGFALNMAGTPRPFSAIAMAILPGMLSGEHLSLPVDRAAAAIVEGFGELNLHPDVPDGIRRLHADGHRIVTLSNGSESYARGLFERAGLADVIEATLSVDDAPAWKPDPRAYRYAVDLLGVEPGRALMVAVHPWDLYGAHRAGLRTAWIDRTGTPYPDLGCSPDIAAESMTELAAMLG